MNQKQIQELAQSGTYQGQPLEGELIETHISWVILTDEWAFKIKKPMEYPFLDYSTLEKRAHYCHQEVQLNSRFSDIYHEVLPIRKRGGWSLGDGGGEIQDYAVRMKRLDDTKKMDNMLAAGKVDNQHIDQLATEIARFHEQTEVIDVSLDLTAHKQLFDDILNVKDWVKENMEPQWADKILEGVLYSDTFLQKHQESMARRIENGFKRDGHGDLHAINIFLYQDPILFDCIEFNDSYRQIDVLNDVAFFCMDLEAKGEWDLSRRFMAQYNEQLACMNTEEDQKLFGYYKFYRASIRAKVNALRAMQQKGAEQEATLEEVKHYFELMESYK